MLEEILVGEALIALTQHVATLCTEASWRGHKVLFAGNGGSAVAAQNPAELVRKLAYDRRALPAISLTTDTSILTAALVILGQLNDVPIGISTTEMPKIPKGVVLGDIFCGLIGCVLIPRPA